MIVEAKEKHLLNLVVSYLVCNASWTPVYDVRVFTKEKALKVYCSLLVSLIFITSLDSLPWTH